MSVCLSNQYLSVDIGKYWLSIWIHNDQIRGQDSTDEIDKYIIQMLNWLLIWKSVVVWWIDRIIQHLIFFKDTFSISFSNLISTDF